MYVCYPTGGGYANVFMVKRTMYTNIFYILKIYK
jgi:hypothetical protein